MDTGRESAIREGNDYHTDGSWAPATPAKSNSSVSPPICTDGQKNKTVEAIWSEPHRNLLGKRLTDVNWSESDELPIGFQQRGQDGSGEAACCNSTDLINMNKNISNLDEFSPENNMVRGDSTGIYGYLDDPDRWKNVSFCHLMALADAANTITASSENKVSSMCNPSTPTSSPQIVDSLFSTSFGNYSLTNQNSLMGSRLAINNSCPMDPQHYGNSVSFHLHSPITTGQVLSSTSLPLAPITPDKAGNAENVKLLDSKNLIVNERNADSTDKQIKIIDGLVGVDGIQNEQLALLKDQAGTDLSNQLLENHNPDNERDQGKDTDKTPQIKTRKRRHRPKVIEEGKIQPRKPRTPKPAAPKDPRTGKRKYVRKNGLNKPASTPTKEFTGETTDLGAAISTKTCRRNLNVDFEHQSKEENSEPSFNCDYMSREKIFINGVQTRSATRYREEMEAATGKAKVHIAYHVIPSENQMFGSHVSVLKRKTSVPSIPPKTICPNNKLMVDPQDQFRRGKCRITFSEETHDKELSTTQVMVSKDAQTVQKSPNDSSSSNNGINGKHPCNIIHDGELSFANRMEHYNSPAYPYMANFPVSEYTSSLPNLQFPAVNKRKRTEKGQSSSAREKMPTAENLFTRVWSSNNACKSCFSSEINCSFQAACVSNNYVANARQDMQQSLRYILPFHNNEKLTKKRSICAPRVRGVTTLTETTKQLRTPSIEGGHEFVQRYLNLNNQYSICVDALTENTSTKMAKKKRTKRSYPSTSEYFASMSEQFITTIIEHFENLNINKESNQAVREESNALVPYNMWLSGRSSFSVSQMNGMLVPFEGPFHPVRKPRARPKVDLDDETTRVWKLLLEDINSVGIDGTDEAKAKWWEEERRVFRGRADSFIARMRLVQGDRRFSQWKGSVIDSVIGVFLTQNVSDHLSSSAFMSLAARFPLKPTCTNGKPGKGIVSIPRTVTEACHAIQCDEEKSNHPPCLNIAFNHQEKKSIKEPEVVYWNNSAGGKSQNAQALDSSACSLSYLSTSNSDMCRESARNNHMMGINTGKIEDQEIRDEELSSQNSIISSQNSQSLFSAQGADSKYSHSQGNSEADLTAQSTSDSSRGSTSFVNLLQKAGSITTNGIYEQINRNMPSYTNGDSQSEVVSFYSLEQNKIQVDNFRASLRQNVPSANYQLNMTTVDLEGESHEIFKEHCFFNVSCKQQEEYCPSEQSGLSAESASHNRVLNNKTSSSQHEKRPMSKKSYSRDRGHLQVHYTSTSHLKNDIELQSQGCLNKAQQATERQVDSDTMGAIRSKNASVNRQETKNVLVEPNINELGARNTGTPKPKRGRKGKEKETTFDWDSLRKEAQAKGGKGARTVNTMNSLDWEAVREADVDDIANTIKERGMNNLLADRIKDFLNRLIREHGSLDLEWLRDVPPDKAKEYLLSVRGLGLKSVECVRLLTLHHLAFPVDTNVGRIAVRLGWVPIQPLPESLQLHLLELYPVLESIQKYLWPRICKLDQRTLYELHYQMITFGKVFCTKSKPNCNACPMRGECRHFASAFASARLALPAPEEKSIVCVTDDKMLDQNPIGFIHPLQLPSPQFKPELQSIRTSDPIVDVLASPEPIVEIPASPEPEQIQILEREIEDTFCEDPDEIPIIKLNILEFTQNLQNYVQQNMELQEGNLSKAIVSVSPEAASIPMPKLKNISRLRTEHQVYELPDSHPLLEGLDKRELDDPSPYLLAIWTPGETANSIQPPEKRCILQDSGELCQETTCSSCNSVREANSQTVRGTLLIPCRTAMRGSFPLNGTYFQVNEVFADHESSLNPIHVPRDWIWKLPRRTVYFGTSIPTIFKGLSTESIQYCFWRGFVCVRGFDQKTRAPRPLLARLHFPASKLTKTKEKTGAS